MRLIEPPRPIMAMTTDTSFIETKEYRRFVEFCDACKRSKFIGLCYGPPGVGKTKSARHYSNWDFRDHFLEYGLGKFKPPVEVRNDDTIVFTPAVVHSPRELANKVKESKNWLHVVIIGSFRDDDDLLVAETTFPKNFAKLIIVDECDRLSAQGLELFRSIFDEDGISIVFMGMPGLEKRLARYPQLYSRIGFVHEFRTMSADEVRFVIQSQWSDRKWYSQPDSETIAHLVRTTNGNFRLLQRLLVQAERIMHINGLAVLTPEVVAAAREILIIGID